MHGRLFTFFDTAVPSYFALIALGFVFAATMGALWARRLGQNPDVIVDLGLVSLLSGFAGARALHVFADGFFMDYVHLCTDPSLVNWRITEAECKSADYAGAWDAAANVCHPVTRNCFAWAELGGGFTFLGGFIAATFTAAWLFKRDRFPLWKAVDMGGMMVPIGLGFGRLGCLLAGCCFGRPDAGLPWALSFPPGSPASDWQAREGLLHHHLAPSLPVHPTQLYESFAAFAIAAFGILYLHGRKRYDGQVFAAFLALYGVARFSIEFFRSDDRGGVLGISTSQWISLGLIACAWALHVRRRNTGIGPGASGKGAAGPGPAPDPASAGTGSAGTGSAGTAAPKTTTSAALTALPGWLGVLVLVSFGMLGCSSEQTERFLSLDESCTGSRCNGTPPVLGGGNGNTQPQPLDAGGDSGAGLTLTGQVAIAVSQDLGTLRDLEDAVLELTATGADEQVTVFENYSPDDQFSLPVSQLPARISVRKVSGDADLLTTLQWVNGAALPLELLITERAVLRDIAENLAVNPSLLDDAAGHAVLRFVDQDGLPLTDVRVTGSSVIAPASVIAYDLGATYTDAIEATGERGAAVVINFPATALPGGAVAFEVERAGEVHSVDVVLARDAVSLLSIVLPR